MASKAKPRKTEESAPLSDEPVAGSDERAVLLRSALGYPGHGGGKAFAVTIAPIRYSAWMNVESGTVPPSDAIIMAIRRAHGEIVGDYLKWNRLGNLSAALADKIRAASPAPDESTSATQRPRRATEKRARSS